MSAFKLQHVVSDDIGWATILCALLIVWGSGYVVYQTTLHPLASYPGPLLAKLTNLYSVYHATRGTRHADLFDLHRKHGPFVRFGPNHISVNSASALGQIYGHQSNVQKGTWYSVYYSVSIFNAIDKKVHARKKRVMSHAFSDQALRSMQPYILDAVREWCDALGLDGTTGEPIKVGEWSSPRDMSWYAAYMIFDVLGEICFGKTFGTSKSEDNRYFLDLMRINVWFLNIIGQMPILGKAQLGYLMMYGQRERRARQVAFSRQQLKARLALGPDSNGRRDIIHYLRQARDPDTGEGYSETELMSEATLLLGAGSDTANTTLASIWFYLLHNAACLTRVTQEVRSAYQDLEDIVSGPTLSGLVYLRACVDECLRICPPIPMPLPRDVLSGGIIVDEHFFLEGTTIGVPTYTLHHDPRYFDQPFLFDPGRFLVAGSKGLNKGEGRSEEEVAKTREAFAPFSVGPRSCIGKNVALLEIYLAVARAVWLYNIRLAPGSEHSGVGRNGEYNMKDHFIVGKEGPIVQFQRRI